MKYIILLAALCASTLAFSAAPKWPRLPLNVLLSGKFNNLEETDGKIVGGVDVAENEIPFQISLKRNGLHSCGGSVLAANKVLTAAHCTDGAILATLTVGAGGLSVNRLPSSSAVSKIAQNAQFNQNTLDYDVSVLTLASPFDLTGNNIKAVDKLADTLEPEAGLEVTVSGWGTTTEGGSLSSTLQKVVVNIVSRESCVNAYPGATLTNNMICAAATGKDSCQGDSGGPLFTGTASTGFVQVGIVSWGRGCARPLAPGVYSNVAALRTWIEGEMAP